MHLDPPSAVVPLQSRGLWLAVDAQLVSEILGGRSARRLAGAHDAVLGAVAWRGRAVTLVDIGLLLESVAPLCIPRAPRAPQRAPSQPALRVPEGPRRLLVVESGPNVLAIGADVVREVQPLDEGTVAPPEPSDHPLAPRRANLWNERLDLSRWRLRSPSRAGMSGRSASSYRTSSEPPSKVLVTALILDIPAITSVLVSGASGASDTRAADASLLDGDTSQRRKGAAE